MKENRVINYKGVDIHYTVSGDKASAKDTIVFLHPAFSSKEIFQYQLDYFGKEYYAVAIDMIGHGDSQQDKPVVNMNDMPDIIKSVMDKEGVEKAHLAGVSLGSLIVQGFGDRYPESTKSVTVTGGYSIHKDNKDIQKAQGKEMGKWFLYMIFSMKRFRKMVIDTSTYAEHSREVFTKGADKFTRKSFLSMNGMDKIMRDTEEKVIYPLLLIVGEHDIDLAKDAVDRLSKIEECETVTIADAGHYANIDNPDAFNKTLESFVGR